ncbi:hypothetical protein H2201_008024 [Coniosporium apollinis]|uniref:Neutral ceramidase n=2 Tax=Coniosporium TaxID=2810619 RepID=A0ABQ9NLJ6_9PEZI|nr:hypothetical protein H2199_004160 [Cladosporium sp. JES 115]KAJ9657811.1 hypothetical protein H2201_008024 [Coniosporium apollinis]
MARPHIAVALAAATFALLVIYQLTQSFGLPQLDYWHWKSEGTEYGRSALQSPISRTTGLGSHALEGDQYLLGVGKADITGPVVELNLMGYANTSQIGSGLRQRLYSRAFIIGSPTDPSARFVYLVLDTQSGDTAVRHGILEGLTSMGSEYSVYQRSNVAVTGTHSHSGPGAWLNYLLPQITSRGFSKQSYQAIVDGALLSIRRAHEGLTPGRLAIGTTVIKDANINRSLYAYLANPASERERYADNVDKNMTLLRFTRDEDGRDIGILTWFPVHGTSMLGNNTLITGDNKGVAAYLFEKDMEESDTMATGFVAGFSQANVGDTTPNVLGAYCEYGPDEGKECRLEDSTCNNSSQPCHGRGPFFGLDDHGTRSCYEIGRRQYTRAKDLHSRMLSSSPEGMPVTGPTVSSFHVFRDFSNYTFMLPNGTEVRTCSAALGYSFAAGTSDGPGAFDFRQNTTHEGEKNPVWAVVGGLLHPPTEEQRRCQGEKAILLDVGESKKPYDWSPNIVDIQLLRVGQLLIIVSPGEATTMAGRRWREAIAQQAKALGLLTPDPRNAEQDPVVVLGGPANTYTHYIATREEYAVQRYEGASTLYGPYTLDAYINTTASLLPYLSPTLAGDLPALEKGPDPPINTNRSLSFIRGVVLDSTPWWRKFGDVVTDVERSYSRGQTVKATFQAANPRNNLRLEGTYVAIELFNPETRSWETHRDDEDWELWFRWRRTSTPLGWSEIDVFWETDQETAAGRYRIRYFGDSKALSGNITPFEGASGIFDVV